MANHSDLTWKKSTRSGPNGCVEVAFCNDGQVALRDSKGQHGPVLTFASHEWEAFIGGVREGLFNHGI